MGDSIASATNISPSADTREFWNEAMFREVNCEIADSITCLTFSESRDRLSGKFGELKHRITTAKPGDEFQSVSNLLFEMKLLARSLGLPGRPIDLFRLPAENNIEFHMIRFNPSDCGMTESYIMAAHVNSDNHHVFSIAVSDEDRSTIARRLESWKMATQNQQASQWRPINVSDRDITEGVLDSIDDMARTYGTEVVDLSARARRNSNHNPSKRPDSENEATDIKKIVRKEVARFYKHHLTDDMLIGAYLDYGSGQRAADGLTKSTGQRVSKDRVYRALHRHGGPEAVREMCDSASVIRSVASQTRDKAKTFKIFRK